MSQFEIKKIEAREILDSRGNPTVEAKVILGNDIFGKASVPSGASTGASEALELRDDEPRRYGGKGVLRAVANVCGPIAKRLCGQDVSCQREIDEAMIRLDGTQNKSHLGANAILAVSLASSKAAAKALQTPLYKYIRKAYKLISLQAYKLPYPMMNILNGGRHADWAIDLQECMIIPQQKKFSERVRCGAEVFHALCDVLKKRGYQVGVGDEGGYAPCLKSNEEAFKLIGEAVKKAGYKFGKEVMLGIDAASSEFYNAKTGRYEMKIDKKKLSAEELSKLYLNWVKKYPIISFEDPFAEDDWQSWQDFVKKLKNLMLVGDDLFTTNVKRLQKGIELGAANAILIKPNQIGTLSETIDAIVLAQKNNYKVIISHRSGETDDTFIADLAVAVGADYIKTGSLSRMERVAKYNRLMEIEKEII